MVRISSLEVPHPMKVFFSIVMMADGKYGVLVDGLTIVPNPTAEGLDYQTMVSKESIYPTVANF